MKVYLKMDKGAGYRPPSGAGMRMPGIAAAENRLGGTGAGKTC